MSLDQSAARHVRLVDKGQLDFNMVTDTSDRYSSLLRPRGRSESARSATPGCDVVPDCYAQVQRWISGLLERDGSDIFRMKGVLDVAHAKERFVFHAVRTCSNCAVGITAVSGVARATVTTLSVIVHQCPPSSVTVCYRPLPSVTPRCTCSRAARSRTSGAKTSNA